MFQENEVVKYRNIVESLFNLSCNVFEYEAYKEESVTKNRLKSVYKALPCRRSYSTGTNVNYIKTGSENIDYVNVNQYVKLFIPYDIVIKEGSYIEIYGNGVEEYYEYSGFCLRYDTHNEVLIKSVKRWA